MFVSLQARNPDIAPPFTGGRLCYPQPDAEQQLRAWAAEGEVAKLVNCQEVGFIELAEEPIELVVLLGFFESADESGGGKEAGAKAQWKRRP